MYGDDDWDDIMQSIKRSHAYNIFVGSDRSTIYANNSNGSQIATGIAGVDDTRVIQAALNGLTPSRLHKQTIIVIGNYIITDTLIINSYSRFEVIGKLSLANGINKSIITNSSYVVADAAKNTEIEIIGGEWDGNKANQTILMPVISLCTPTNIAIKEAYVHNSRSDGVSCTGVHNSSIENCRFDNNDQLGIRITTNPTYGDSTDRVRIINNSCNGNGIHGIWFQGDGSGTPARTTVDCTAIGNICNNNINAGIYVDWNAYAITIANNICEGNQTGIFLNGQKNGLPYYNSREVNICGNLCRNNTQNGIAVSYTGQGKITGNLCILNRYHGILVLGSKRIDITDNICLNNSQQSASSFSGICLFGNSTANTQLCRVFGNRCLDDQNTKTQKYGIEEQATYTNDNIIECNDVRENLASLLLSGINSIARGNWGFNPVASSWVTVGISPFDYTNNDGYPEEIIVQSGTVSKIEHSTDGLNYTTIGLTCGKFHLNVGEHLRVTYSSLPNIKKIPQ